MVTAEAIVFAFLFLSCGGGSDATGPASDTLQNQNTLAQISVAAGNNQLGVFGEPLKEKIVTRATGTNGGPVNGVTINFSVIKGGGSVSPGTAVTDKDGNAATTWVLGSESSPQALSATTSALPSGSINFAATAGELVGTSGGMVVLDGGGTLQVRPGTSTVPLIITSQRVADPATLVGGGILAGSAVRLGPDGTEFLLGAVLSLPLPGSSLGNYRVAYFDSAKRYSLLDEAVGSAGKISAIVTHLSDYLLVTPTPWLLKPGKQYTWSMRNCPSRIGGLGLATCEDIRRDARAAFQTWSSLVNVVFSEASNTATADIKIDFRSGGALQWFDMAGNAGWSWSDADFEIQLADRLAWTPSIHTAAPGDASATNDGPNAYHAVLHEIGHLLGLSHPFSALDKLLDANSICVLGSRDGIMSYCSTSIPLGPKCSEVSLLKVLGFSPAGGAARCPSSLQLLSASNVGSFTAGTVIGLGVIKVKFQNSDGSPVQNYPILFGPLTTGVSVASRAAFTSSDGIASMPAWTLGASAGEQCVYAYAVADDRSAQAAVKACASVLGASAPTINLSSNSATFSAATGASSPASQSITVTNAGTGQLSGLAIASVSYGAGASGWLTASLSATTAPATLTLAPTTGSLALGTYTSVVTVSSSANGVTNSPQLITVTFTVTAAAAAPTISLSSLSANFSSISGSSNPASQTIQVTNGGTGTLSGLAVGSIAYAPGTLANWLTASLNSTTAPATLTLSAATGSLPAGFYVADVPITSSATGVANSPRTMTVSFTIAAPAAAPTISLSPTSATFAATAGAGNPSAQTIQITNGGTGTLSGLGVGTITYGSGASGWLTASLNATTAPATLALTAITGSLAPNTYIATVAVTSSAPGVTNSPQNMTVTFAVTPPGGSQFQSLTAGQSHTCGLTAGGSAYCWGNNFAGALGDGTTNSRPTPVAVSGGLTLQSLAAGDYHTCGLTAAGAAYCWGFNFAGELGDGTTTTRLTPVLVAGGRTFQRLTAGSGYTCGLTNNGATFCWGYNSNGQLGDGTTTSRQIPVAVSGGISFQSITAGFDHTCGLTSGGAAYCWGSNNFYLSNQTAVKGGQLGDGTTTDRLSPVAVSGSYVFQSLSAGWFHTCGATTGLAYCWGLDRITNASRPIPTVVSGGLTFQSLTVRGYACGLTTSGTAYCWGVSTCTNSCAGVGDGGTVNRSDPVAVSGGLTFKSLSSGGSGYACGVTTTGTSYCWGINSDGQLGDGTTTNRLTPVAVRSSP